MNLVAHQFLSFNNPSLQIGNLLGETVKGNKYLVYPEDIQQGILLHRAIDHFTDSHPIVKKSTTHFHSTHHKYAPIITDLMYDYYLIKHWRNYHSSSFQNFKEDCYTLFHYNYDNFPSDLQHMLDHLLKYDWFENYKTLEGIQKTLDGISKRTKFPNQLHNALEEMKTYETELEKDFLIFFPELIDFAKKFIQRK